METFDPTRAQADPTRAQADLTPSLVNLTPSQVKKERLAKRLLWIMIALAAAVIVAAGAAWIPVPYVIQSPGPTVNVLGTQGDTPVLELAQSGDEGVFELPDDGGSEGELLMVTVSSLGSPGTTARLGNVVAAWLSPAKTVTPYADLYAPETTAEQVAEAGAAQMESSHSAAAIAALEYLGVPMDTTMTVAGFSEGTKAADALEVGDVLVSITTPDGVVHPVDKPSVPFRLLETVPPKSILKVTILRDGEEVTVDVPTVAAADIGAKPPADEDEDEGADEGDRGEGDGGEDDHAEADGDEGDGDEDEQTEETSSRMGVYLTADTDLPLDVTIHLERIGGPSAGLAFALGIIDELTPGGIVGDDVVAATGALDFAGNVVPIGGVKQKMYGAVRDGARWFLAPKDNCDQVVGNIPDGLDVIAVSTLTEGVEAVEGIADGNTADLPRCEPQK